MAKLGRVRFVISSVIQYSIVLRLKYGFVRRIRERVCGTKVSSVGEEKKQHASGVSLGGIQALYGDVRCSMLD